MAIDPSAASLQGSVAVVTGGAGGIGRASGIALAEAGAKVVVADIDAAGADTVAAEIVSRGGEAIALAADLAEENAVRKMIAGAVAHFGRLDILHNNAALTDPETLARDTAVTDMAIEVWERTLSVNLRSQMLTCKYAIPAMLEGDRGGGSIINMSSGASLVGDAIRVAYGTSKAGVNTLTRYVAASHGKQGIRANTIVPGLILTDAVARQVPEEVLQAYCERLLTREVGRPSDIASLVVFLASDSSRYITGQMIVIDGGMSIHV